MTSTNVLNRKLEEVWGVGKEFETVAGLWGVSQTALKNSMCLLTHFAEIQHADSRAKGEFGRQRFAMLRELHFLLQMLQLVILQH